MDHAGYDIQREFYIHDHGSQMNTFGNSISTRYMQLADIIAKQGVDIDEAHKLSLIHIWLRASLKRCLNTTLPCRPSCSNSFVTQACELPTRLSVSKIGRAHV